MSRCLVVLIVVIIIAIIVVIIIVVVVVILMTIIVVIVVIVIIFIIPPVPSLIFSGARNIRHQLSPLGVHVSPKFSVLGLISECSSECS